MKLGIFAIASVAMLLTACGVPSASSATPAPKPPSVRSIFLNYVPPNEPGAPHDMQYLVEHFSGDGGYYGTKYFPGTLFIVSHSGRTLQNYKTEQYITANGQTVTKKIITGTIYPYKGELWGIDWRINGTDYEYFLYQTSTNKTWTLTRANQWGGYAMA